MLQCHFSWQGQNLVMHYFCITTNRSVTFRSRRNVKATLDALRIVLDFSFVTE